MTRYALAATIAIGATAGTASAEELSLAIGLPPIHPWSMTYTYVDENIEEATGGKYSAEVYYGSLLNLKQSLTGLRDGIADAAMLVPGYHPAEMPHTNLVVDLAMLGDDSVSVAGAVMEYMFTCPECLEESEDNGSVFVAMNVNPVYMLQTMEPMTTPEDLQGKKIRSFSAFGRWVEYVGGIKMSMSANDIYDALSRGTLDANMHPASELYSLNFKDVVKYITNLPLGTYNGNQFNFNIDTWQAMPEEDRRAIFELFAEAVAHAQVGAENFNDEVLATRAPADGIEVVEPSPELVALTERFIEDDLAKMDEMARENYGIEDAPARIERFQGLVDRWKSLTSEIDDSDPEAVATLYKREVFDKVDMANHGL
ncbi:C4-dicarboxylate TRAP transporter substrate-binding protein [Acuticoccus sp.]|uniref:C4-dicarboxylate TRAP transporter substrate-binding protein n=1 Tax=Acuticoccus sp. TaxID=1904378 RepID=UPI003B518AF9